MSIIGTIARGLVWNTLGSTVTKVIIVVNIFYILSHLSVYEYGLTELVFSVIPVLGIFLLPGIFDTIVADMSVENGRKNHGRMKGLFIQFLKLQTVLGVIAWALLFFGAPIAAQLSGNQSIEYFLRIISFTFLIAPARSAVTMLSVVTIRFVDQSLFSVVEESSKFLFLVLFLGVLHLGPAGLLYASVLAPLIAVLLYLPRTFSAYRQFSGVQALYTHRWWQLVGTHRKWSIGTSYVGSLGTVARLWIIRAMLGTEAVGLFAFAYGIIGHLTGLMPLSAVLKPIVPRYVDNATLLSRLVRGAFKIQLVNAVVFIVIGFITLPLFIHIAFPLYLDATPLVLIMLFALLPGAVGSVVIPVFAALKKQRSFFFATVFKVCVGVVLLPVMILSFGLLGVGIELGVTLFVSAVERYLRLRKLIPSLSMKLRDLVTFDNTERMLADKMFRKFFKKP